MIEFTALEDTVVQIDYNDLIKAYKARYDEKRGATFINNMIKMLDEWEREKGLKFKRVSGDDWQQLLKASGEEK